MIRLDVNRLLKMRGAKSGNMWLVKRGLTYREASRLTSGAAKTLHMKLLKKLCKAFECTPNELFAYETEGEQSLPYLNPLSRTEDVLSPQEMLQNLPQAEVERLMKELLEAKKRRG
ncbi:MAG: DNA-binding Xre family transcriptional regulator [Bacteroidia bacterium]|jgi:DNA-binding Xre family transcriptional regulator